MMFGTKKDVEVKKKSPKKNNIKKDVVVALPDTKKKFSSPEEVTAYYRAEGERVKQALKEFKARQSEVQLQLAKEEYLKISSQKADLDDLKADLLSHKKEVESKVKELSNQKEQESMHKKAVDNFIKKIKLLESESKKIIETREALIGHQKELISSMRNIAKNSSATFKASDVSSAQALLKFETSKEQVLTKAQQILSDEMKAMVADNPLLDDVNEKTVKKLYDLNIKISDEQKKKKDVLKKLELLDISEDKAINEMKKAEEKVKKLEVSYKKLLKQ